MKKHVILAKYALMSAISVGISFTALTGCKDYDDDINHLQQQIDANKSALEKINTTLAGGQWIKSVEKTDKGIKVTLGNETAYEITNGNDGNDGIVYEIGQDGYWYKDGVKTAYKAIGEKGETGADGDKGETGADGPQGPKGEFYYPGNDGYWYLNGNETTGTRTDQKWMVEGIVTAVVTEDGLLKFQGVTGYEDGYVLTMNSAVLRSLVLNPQMYVDGISAIAFNALEYKAMSIATDAILPGAALVSTTEPLYAEYYMNPSSVSTKGIDTENLSFESKTVQVKSRAIPANPKAKFESATDGILKVLISADFAKVNNSLQNGVGPIDIIALNTPLKKLEGGSINDEGEAGNVVSDFAMLYKDNNILQADLAISLKPTQEHLPQTIAVSKADAPCVQMAHNATLDLAPIVETHILTSPEALLNTDKYGLEYKYDMNGISYPLGSNNTNQQDFGKIEGSVFSARVFDAQGTIAAVGRTPIVRITLVDKNNNGAIVSIGYVKIEITAASVAAKEITYDFGSFSWSCDTKQFVFGTKEMNVNIYNELGMTKEQFHNTYTFVAPSTGDGIVTENPNNQTDESFNLVWDILSADAWAKTSNELVATVLYRTAANIELKLIFKARFTRPADMSIAASDLITNYWDTELKYFKLNVAVPQTVGDTDPNHCTFVTNLWSGFQQNKVQAAIPEAYSSFNFNFEFAATNNGKVVDGETLSVSTDKTQLKVGSEVIAQINGVNIEYMNGTKAQKLLATNALFADIRMFGTTCNNLEINISGYGNFQVKFVRPLYMNTKPADAFTDGVDGGSKLDAKKVVELTDWRNMSFDKNPTYYDYYSVTSTLINGAIKCNLGTNGAMIDLPNTLSVTIVNGDFVYKNNGAVLEQPFELYIPIEVGYKWGTLTETVTVNVQKTVGQ